MYKEFGAAVLLFSASAAAEEQARLQFMFQELRFPANVTPVNSEGKKSPGQSFEACGHENLKTPGKHEYVVRMTVSGEDVAKWGKGVASLPVIGYSAEFATGFRNYYTRDDTDLRNNEVFLPDKERKKFTEQSYSFQALAAGHSDLTVFYAFVFNKNGFIEVCAGVEALGGQSIIRRKNFPFDQTIDPYRLCVPRSQPDIKPVADRFSSIRKAFLKSKDIKCDYSP